MMVYPIIQIEQNITSACMILFGFEVQVLYVFIFGILTKIRTQDP